MINCSWWSLPSSKQYFSYIHIMFLSPRFSWGDIQ